MTYRTTPPVAAVYVSDKEQFRRERVAGSFRLTEPDSKGVQLFWYCCPCGCGDIGALEVGNGFKPPKGGASDSTWHWNGSTDKPHLDPSVHHVGHWHGHLNQGIWKWAQNG